MKRTKTIILAFFLTLTTGFVVIAAPKQLPEPEAMSASSTRPDHPPDIPINQNLMILAGCALLFGIHSIYRYNEKKASI